MEATEGKKDFSGRLTPEMDKALNLARHLRNGGMNWQIIAERLNSEGLKTATGLPWNYGNISQYVNYQDTKKTKPLVLAPATKGLALTDEGEGPERGAKTPQPAKDDEPAPAEGANVKAKEINSGWTELRSEAPFSAANSTPPPPDPMEDISASIRCNIASRILGDQGLSHQDKKRLALYVLQSNC